MIIPKTLKRVLEKHINIEKDIFRLMSHGTYEHTPDGWYKTNQACFITGMQYALKIIEDPVRNDMFFIPGEDTKSNKIKNFGKIITKIRSVDNSLEL